MIVSTLSRPLAVKTTSWKFVMDPIVFLGRLVNFADTRFPTDCRPLTVFCGCVFIRTTTFNIVVSKLSISPSGILVSPIFVYSVHFCVSGPAHLGPSSLSLSPFPNFI